MTVDIAMLVRATIGTSHRPFDAKSVAFIEANRARVVGFYDEFDAPNRFAAQITQNSLHYRLGESRCVQMRIGSERRDERGVMTASGIPRYLRESADGGILLEDEEALGVQQTREEWLEFARSHGFEA